MKKNSFLLIGYSNLARNRIIKTFIENKITFSVASKSFNKKIKGAKEQFSDYEVALSNSSANIVYISLPNSLHFNWAKKALLAGYHVIIDKPLTYKLSETRKLITLAKKNNKLLSEAIFFNFHDQFKKIINLLKNKKIISSIDVNFTIPLPSNKSILMSKKLLGGVIMDMGPYAATIHRIFFDKNITYSKINIKKNKQKLPISLELTIKYKDNECHCLFKFGGKYTNYINIFTDNKNFSIDRAFSPPDDIKLHITTINKNKKKIILSKKDNCFKNYLFELISKINNKKYSYYYEQIESDHFFRDKIEKKSLKNLIN